MKWSFRVAALALLGLSIASFATLVWGQGSAPLPPPSGPAVTVPKTPATTKPALPASGPALPPPVSDLPTPKETEIDLPKPPSAPIELPKPVSTPTLPPAGPPTDLPKPSETPSLPPPGIEPTLPPSGVAPPPPSGPAVTLPPAAGVPAIPTANSSPVKPALPVPASGDPAKSLAPATEVKPTAPAQDDAAPGVSEDNLTGRQEPAVSLEWIGPPAAKLGHGADYTIVVRNVCNIAVQQVMVRVRLQQGIQVLTTEPRALSEDNVLMWELGTLLPKQERNLQVKLMSSQKGDVNAQAWVTFTGSSAMRIRVREPKLMIKTIAPEKVLIGDPCTFVVTVSNPGDHPTELVKVHCNLSEGLEHVKGNKVDFDLGNLAPGETRSVQVICGTKAAGEQKCESYAEADGGLKATDKAVATIIMPRIDIEMTGPKLKYLDRKAVYTIKVTNPGDAPAANVTLNDVIPPGFKFVQADSGGRHDFSTRTASWFIGELGPGQSREVKLECLAVNVGEHQHNITATASRGLKTDHAYVTKVEGLSAILLEMVDLDDPVEVGADEVYEVRITNTGSKTETDVKLVCTVPDKMQFKSATGPAKFTQNGNEIVFEPIPRLAPRADAIFRITVKTTAPGVVHFRSRLTSTLLVEPVTKEEATRIYTD